VVTPEVTAEPLQESKIEEEECFLNSDKVAPKVYRWCNLITKYATEFDVPPALVAAIILQESGGNPDAYSHSGAVGLMQVMPKDGIAAKFQCKNGPCFADRPSIKELYDPEFNIRFGTKMIRGLYNRNGSWRNALFRYGPMDVGYSYADKVLAIYERYK
jgi:soluble lytic murein transglycosylase-like protein